MRFEAYHVKATFITDCLATTPASDELFAAWRKARMSKATAAVKRLADDDTLSDELASHTRTLDEVAKGIDEDELSRLMVFPRNPDGQPCIWNYQVLGSLKERATDLAAEIGPPTEKGNPTELKQPASKVEKVCKVGPRLIPLRPPANVGEAKLGRSIERTERPLRGMTQQGPRVTLVASESVKPGWWIEYIVYFWADNKFGIRKEALMEILEMSGFGFGGWRTGGFGSAEVEVAKVANEVPIKDIQRHCGLLADIMLRELIAENVGKKLPAAS